MTIMKKKTHRIKKSLMCAMTALMLTASVIPAQAYANDSLSINIEKPEGWQKAPVTVGVSIDTSGAVEGFTVAKVEAKVGEEGVWRDITGNMSVEITDNCVIYIKVTDAEGITYEQNRSVRCFDMELPTLAASLTDGVLSIQAYDTISGVSYVTVNGTNYTELTEGALSIQLTQKNMTTKDIILTATDIAGNVSGEYKMLNPYYEWVKKQEQQQSGSNDLSTSTDGTAADQVTKAPLPQDAEASEPTDAKGTVEDRVVTGIEETITSTGETVDTVTTTTIHDSKEFFTISTKSGKIFYLIVDNTKQQDNVYFLTEVSERDLMNFTLSDSVTLPNTGTVYAELETEEKVPEVTEEPEEIPETEIVLEEVQMPEEQNTLGSYILIGLIAAIIFGAAYYFKIYKPKHDFDEDDYGSEYEDDTEEQPVREETLDENDEIPEEDEYDEISD